MQNGESLHGLSINLSPQIDGVIIRTGQTSVLGGFFLACGSQPTSAPATNERLWSLKTRPWYDEWVSPHLLFSENFTSGDLSSAILNIRGQS
ncbi:hypothetical protein V6N11_026933 [Hibiscus sabdariffa]|uniref:Uncharacterized protein n=2 Tax=Hibiscus sabdariffa TaxID=183260 RepID=A0ABR1ZXW8_9ROSI